MRNTIDYSITKRGLTCEERRQKLEADYQAFLARGGKVQEVPIGASAHDTRTLIYGRGEKLRKVMGRGKAIHIARQG